MIQIIIVLLTLYVVYQWLNAKPKNFPPGLPTIPLLGSLPFLESNNFHFFLEKLRVKYGPIIGMKFGTSLAVAVCGPEEVIEVLKRDDFSARSSVNTGGAVIGGIMFANGDSWKNQRRFTLRHLRDFGFGRTSVADMVKEEFDEFCAKKLQGKSVVEASGLFNTSAINIIWAMVAGRRCSYEDKKFQKLLHCLETAFRGGSQTGGVINSVPGLKPLVSIFCELEIDRIVRLLNEFFREAVSEHKSTRSETPRDFIDVYLAELEHSDKHLSFCEESLYQVLRDLFAAGTESSSNTVSFAIMYLLLHPEWQEKMAKEIDHVLCGRPPTCEDKHNLPLVDAYLSEVQRCNSIAPLSVPHATTKDTTLGGYFIPKGTVVQVSIWALLQDRNHWGDPQNFRPERFLSPDGSCVKDPYMLLFGAGPRVCPGESLARSFVFLFFVSLLQRYKFALPDGRSPPSTICMSGFTTAPEKFFVAVTSR